MLPLLETEFLKKGYVISDVEDFVAYNEINQLITNEIERVLNVKVPELEQLHKLITKNEVNDVRVQVYNVLNKNVEVIEKCYKIFKTGITTLLGTELASQNKVNLSIQLPNDDTSRIGLHTDTVSGQSEFEAVCWLPFTNVFDTNSFYVFSREDSKEMLSLLPKYHTKGMELLYEDWAARSSFLKLNRGQCLIFSSTLMHGNHINKTNITRVSINVRFKGLFTPYNILEHNEKKIGNFYRPFRISPITKIALEYREPKNDF